MKLIDRMSRIDQDQEQENEQIIYQDPNEAIAEAQDDQEKKYEEFLAWSKYLVLL
jgi:hypothetical protein